jgi:uncharacterized membrane protein YphA (DoxX/SURF4 family)
MTMKRKITIEIICFLLVLLFVYAATNKVIDYQKFKVQIGQSPMLTGLGDFIPPIVIAAEFIVSVFLFIPKFRLISLFASFSLMIMFTAYIIAILNFSSYVPCSCGGVLEKLGWTAHLYFNISFILLSLIGIILQSQEETDFKTALAFP